MFIEKTKSVHKSRMYQYNYLSTPPLPCPLHFLSLFSTLFPATTKFQSNHRQQRNKGARQDEPAETLLSLCMSVPFCGFCAPWSPCRPGEEGADECPCGFCGGGGRCVCGEEGCALLGRGCGGGCGMSIEVPDNRSAYTRADAECGTANRGLTRRGRWWPRIKLLWLQDRRCLWH